MLLDTCRIARRALAVLLVLAAMAEGLVACGQAEAPAREIVLTASATSNEPGAVLTPAEVVELGQDALSRGGAIADVVNPNTGQPVMVTLTPLRRDGQVEYGPNRDALLAANLSRVERLLAAEAADRPFDLLSLLAMAARVSSGPGTLIVVTSGLSTAGGFDLRQVGWYASPSAVATQLKREGLLPDLAGWNIEFSGLADTAGSQPALPQPQRAELTAYVIAICQTAGALSCRTDQVTRPDPPSRSTFPAPVVPVPAVISVQGPRHSTVETIPADMFFRLDSSQLLPGTDSILRPLAARAAAGSMQVSITGYASPESGSATYNKALSLARARAVEARLIALGVTPSQIVQVTGAGIAGRAAADCYRHGHLDEAICARMRHVVITLTPVSATTA